MTQEELFLVLERENLSRYVMPYYEEDGFFYNADGSIGIAFECVPLVGISSGTEQSLRSFLSALPEGASFQFILWGSSDIYKAIDTWRENKYRGLYRLRGIDQSLMKEMVDEFWKFLESKRHEPITKTFRATAKNHRLFITVKLGGKSKTYSLMDSLFKNLFGLFSKKKEDELEDFSVYLKKLSDVREKLRGSLQSAGLVPYDMTGGDMVEVLYKLLNPSKDWRDVPEYRGDIPISRASVHSSTKARIYEDFFELDGFYVRALSVKTYPEEWSMVDVLNYLAGPYEESVYDFDYLIVLNGIKLPESEKGKVKRNATMVLNQHVPYSLVPRLKFKHQDLSYAMERIEKGADLYAIDFLIVVFSRTKEELELRTGRVKTEFRKLGWQLEEDKYINFADFISVLPFGFDKTMADFLSKQRVRAVFEENVATLAPVYAGWKGTFPELFFFSNTGELVSFDYFSNPAGGYNSYVVGMTGAGKSVFLQYVMWNYLAGGNRVWVIDIGGSYERFCHAFGGDYIEIKPEAPICLNPFTSITDYSVFEDYLEFLTNWFYLMGAVKEQKKSEEQEKFIRAHLDEALRESYDKYGADSSVDTVIDALRKYAGDQRISDFIKHLQPYSSVGPYGKFFNGKATVFFDKFLTVFENGQIENVPDLRDPVIMLLTYHISKEIFFSGMKDYKNLVIIDEAHKFLGNPKIDIFIEQAYRRFRKHGASMIIGTQSFADIMPTGGLSRAGRVITENSFWSMFMQQKAESINAMKQSNLFAFGDWGWNLLLSTRTRAGEFSEAVIYSGAGIVKARVVLDDFMKAMFFTTPHVRKRIQDLVASGMSYLEAIKKVQEEMKQ
ncbi:MAG: TraC family protein [Aquificaceae bacterium]